MTEDLKPESTDPELEATPEIESRKAEMKDPIGDVSDGEAGTAIEPEVDSETEAQIEAFESEGGLEPESDDNPEPEDGSEPEFKPKPRPPAKLERLQKILAQAGVASRRKAEEMIEQGRVQINGKVITELGTKADAARDHIRVDGKLLQGAERLRYFVLNKPRGFVTTVKDPEGRPTVMQFFDKMRERLYPVGRLDYMSEGLLLVTNDGELANRLTRAASGVEKTYLVKVAGQPSESELDILRGGVAIERGKPGSAQVRTSPARIRQVRQGDNPWYEVVLIEGRNRELRKMFEEIGHFVEKIRRVGYGPLVLDQEPGNLRELQPAELEALRQTAEGKVRTPKSKELRRRNAMDAAGLPTVTPRRTSHPRPEKPFAPRAFEKRAAAAEERPNDYRPKRSFSQGNDVAKPSRPSRSADERPRPAAGRSDDRSRRTGTGGPSKFGPARPTGRPSARPAWQKDDRPTRPPVSTSEGAAEEARPTARKPYTDRPATGRTFSPKPAAGRTYGDKPAAGRTYGAKPDFSKPSGKPAWSKPASSDRPPYKRPAAPRREAEEVEDLGPRKPFHLQIEPILESERPSPSRADRPSTSRPGAGRPASARSSSPRPFRSEGGLPRAFTTSSGKPRPGGARPSSKPGKPSSARSFSSAPSDRPASRSRSIDPRTGSGYRPAPGGKRSFDGPGSSPRSPRPYTSRTESAPDSRSIPNTKKFSGSSSYRGTGSRSESPRGESSGHERKSGTGWKPKTRYGGPAKPAANVRSKPRPGSSAKPSHKTKPTGKRPGGAPGGKKRS
jgi:23S rRNA pseudouridine2605 synthase